MGRLTAGAETKWATWRTRAAEVPLMGAALAECIAVGPEEDDAP